MQAVILDVDGTLLQSMQADEQLYFEAVRSVLGPVRLRGAWERYQHVTDGAILVDICTDNGIAPEPHRLARVQAVFVGLLTRHLQHAGAFEEIPGAREFVRALHDSSQHRVAYATGGWGAAARLKLNSAGFPLSIPLASADDRAERTGIMRHALSMLPGKFESITYYGDGVWDQVATRELGWQFIPVGDALGGLTHYGPKLVSGTP